VISSSLAIARKDLRLAFAGGQGPVQAVLLGLLLVFIFSLSAAPGDRFSPQQAMAIFWLCSSFAVVLIFPCSFVSRRRTTRPRPCCFLPVPVQGLWLGKTLAGLALLLLCQISFFPAALVFLGLDPGGSLHGLLLMVVGVDLGLCILGGLIGAMGHGHGAKDALLTIIVFPLQIPLLLSGIRIGVGLMQGAPLAGVGDWFGLVLAFDAVFAGAALFLFPHVFRGE
jgi:ABC-type transport system involved in cytochrome c biogenesis, permease component